MNESDRNGLAKNLLSGGLGRIVYELAGVMLRLDAQAQVAALPADVYTTQASYKRSCEPAECHKVQTWLIAERDASAARVRELEAKLATCSKWAQERDRARLAAEAERDAMAAVVDVARNVAACLHPHGDEYRKLRDVLHALDEATAAAAKPRQPTLTECCYCSDYQSSGLPCPPGKCPNVPASAPVAEPREIRVGSVWRDRKSRQSFRFCGVAETGWYRVEPVTETPNLRSASVNPACWKKLYEYLSDPTAAKEE